MTPQRINQIGNTIVVAVKFSLWGLACYVAYHGHWAAAIFLVLMATVFRWKNDGKLADDGEPPKV